MHLRWERPDRTPIFFALGFQPCFGAWRLCGFLYEHRLAASAGYTSQVVLLCLSLRRSLPGSAIGSYRLYVEPTGKLFVNTGTVKLRVTPEEALELLDYMLTFARYFDESQPAGMNGHAAQAYTKGH